MSEYSTKQIDEDDMTEFVHSKGCGRVILGQYFNGSKGAGQDCQTMDWAYCDICRAQSRQEREFRFIELAGPDQVEVEVEAQAGQEEPDGRQMIADVLYAVKEAKEYMFRVMRELQQQCIYCMLIHGTEQGRILDDQPHMYDLDNYFPAEMNGYGFIHFQTWRKELIIQTGQDFFACRLSQQVCGGTEDSMACESPDCRVCLFYTSGRS
jgi:hypothetical protein